MRILQIVADGDPGGGTTHVLQILRDLGSSYSLGLVTQRGSYLYCEAKSLGIETFAVNFFRSRIDARVPFRLRRIMQNFEPQLVHAHGGRAGFFQALATTRVPTVYTVHGYHFLHKSSFLVRWLALKAELVVSRRADRIIFVSNHDAQVAQRYNLLSDPTRSVVIHNGIQLKQIPKAKRTGASNHIGFIGRLDYPKDPVLFLEVLERLPRYKATLVGGGSLENEVRTEIKRRELSRVRTVGSVSHNQALKELSNLDVVVMTSRWEGMPLLPLEAMGSGVPVVATNVGGLSELIESGRSGLLIDSRSADDLAQAVAQVNEDSALREHIIENARVRVKSLFSEERMLTEIHKVYQQLASRKH